MKSNQPSMRSEEKFFLALHASATSIQKMADKALRPADLTIAEYTMLRIIENTPGITAGEAKKRVFSTAASVAQLIAQLERRNFIRRGQDSNDARRLPLTLSPTGKKQLQNGKTAVAQLIRSLKLHTSLLDSMTKDLSIFLSSLPPYGSR
jgi:DNA-binding MarR family transcriptional regulator